MEESTGFASLGLSEGVLEAIARKGFEEPSAIQRAVIPVLLSGERDVIGQAQTGTGKTAAFGLPLVDRLQRGGSGPKAIILTPTRELAVQVAEEIASFLNGKGLRILAVYGGQAIGAQIRALRDGVDIVVGTPGRVIDHLDRKTLSLQSVTRVILDEADEMLDMGFIEDVERILSEAPSERRILLFSATMPERIRAMAERHMADPLHIRVESPSLTASLTEQLWFEVREEDKFEALCRIIDMEEDFYGLVFCRTKVLTAELSRHLSLRGYGAEALSGDVSQAQREEVLSRFRDRRRKILVATDVAARGIDIEELSHVINFSLPQDAEAYVHRVGRTGRAGRQGMAITFVTPSEYRKLMYIRHATRAEINKRDLPAIDAVIEARRARILKRILRKLEGEAPADASPSPGPDDEASGGAPSSDASPSPASTDMPAPKAPPARPDPFASMAAELLEGRKPAEVLSAVLRLEYHAALDRSRYREIRQGGGQAPGAARVFIRIGRRDGLDKMALIEMIEERTGVSRSRMGNIKVFEQYSIVQAPLREAEAIIKRLSSDGKPLARFDRAPAAAPGKEPQGRGGHEGRGEPPRRGRPEAPWKKRPGPAVQPWKKGSKGP